MRGGIRVTGVAQQVPEAASTMTLPQDDLAELEQRQQQQDAAQRPADGGVSTAAAADGEADRQEGAAAAAAAVLDSSDSEPEQVQHSCGAGCISHRMSGLQACLLCGFSVNEAPAEPTSAAAASL